VLRKCLERLADSTPSSFQGRFARINPHLKTGQSLVNFKSDGVDIAIRLGTGDWRGLRAIMLLYEEFFPAQPQRRPPVERSRINVIDAAADRTLICRGTPRSSLPV
jgi:DNA-binding transcriptional LysR family regulator